jgi:methylglutaconyl-CoA hydratase
VIGKKMSYQTLQLGDRGEVATITLNRPEKRNAISPQMIEELLAVLQEIESSAARAAIVTGAGKAFCAGMDLDVLRSLAGQSLEQHVADSRLVANLLYRIYSFPKPIIAAVNGAAIAGGCGIATLADFTLSVPDAQFGYTEVKIGFIPAAVSVFLRRQTGDKIARDLLISGRIIDATEAYRLGLVTELVAAEKLAARAHEFAGILLAASPTSVTRTKRLLLAYEEAALQTELEMAIRENAAIKETADFREGLSAFLEKREPRWSGR